MHRYVQSPGCGYTQLYADTQRSKRDALQNQRHALTRSNPAPLKCFWTMPQASWSVLSDAHYTCVHDTRKQGSRCPAHTPNHKSWPLLPSTCVMANHGIYLQLHSIHCKSQPLSPQICPHYSHRPFFPICTPHSSPHSPAQAHQCQPQLLSLSAGTPVQLVIPIPQHLPQQTPTATPCPNIQPNASHTSNIQPNASHSPIPQIIRPTAHQCP